MKRTLTRLAFAAMLALTLLASTSNAFAKDITAGRETAWTDSGPLPSPVEPDWANLIGPLGVTWEE